MALVSLTTSEDKEVRVDPVNVMALEELSDTATRVHLANGEAFVIRGALATVETALGL
jgi:hypothetical protein